MLIHEFGNMGAPVLVLIPGTYASWQIFSPLVGLLQDRFHMVVPALDGQQTDLDGKAVPNAFTTVDDQARHALSVFPTAKVRVFPKMNHAQLLTDCPEELAKLLRE